MQDWSWMWWEKVARDDIMPGSGTVRQIQQCLIWAMSNMSHAIWSSLDRRWDASLFLVWVSSNVAKRWHATDIVGCVADRQSCPDPIHKRGNPQTIKSLCVTFEQPSLPHITLQQKRLISGSLTSFFPRIQCVVKLINLVSPFLEVFALLFFIFLT